MKAILISIQPKWVEKICCGNKTIEVRKTRPKIDTPFKCYIYCTKGSKGEEMCFGQYTCHIGNGKVIGHFVCDSMYGISNFLPYDTDDIHHDFLPYVLEQTCLQDYEIDEYLGAKDGYGWHISDLVIYDEPKELSEFYAEGDCDCMNCKKCAWFDSGNGYNVEADCNLAYKGADFHKSFKPILRAPQSWCYVEEKKNDYE